MSLFTKNIYTPPTRHQKTTQSCTYNPLIARQLIPLHRYVAGSRPSQGRLKAVQPTPQPLSEKYLHPLNPSDPSSLALTIRTFLNHSNFFPIFCHAKIKNHIFAQRTTPTGGTHQPQGAMRKAFRRRRGNQNIYKKAYITRFVLDC